MPIYAQIRLISIRRR